MSLLSPPSPPVVEAPKSLVMWSPSAVAERDGVSKQSVATRARKFAEVHNLAVERDAQGRIVKFNLAQYDLLRGQFADPAQKRAPKTAEPQKPASDSYDEARRTQAWLAAERERLSLDEMKSRLVPVDQVRDAFATVAGIIAGVIDRLPNVADDIAAEVAKSGGHGARVALSNEASRLRTEIADALRAARAGMSTGKGEAAQPSE